MCCHASGEEVLEGARREVQHNRTGDMTVSAGTLACSLASYTSGSVLCYFWTPQPRPRPKGLKYTTTTLHHVSNPIRPALVSHGVCLIRPGRSLLNSVGGERGVLFFSLAFPPLPRALALGKINWSTDNRSMENEQIVPVSLDSM